MVFSTQEFLLFTQELINFTQEILPLLPKKLRTPYSRNLRVPNHEEHNMVIEKKERPCAVSEVILPEWQQKQCCIEGISPH